MKGAFADMNECSRFITVLREAGWTDTQINDFILYIEADETSYNQNEILFDFPKIQLK